MNTAVAYVRVSTQEQALEGVSLAAQEERIKAYCSLAGLTLAEVVKEAGVSAGIPLADRPGGQTVLEAVKTKRVQHIIALKLDRLFRDAIDALTMTRDWDKTGISLHLVDMGGQALNTSSAMGRFFLSMMASFAELEKNLIGERTTMAMQHKKAMRQVYSPTPFGFERVGNDLRINEQEIAIILQVKVWRESGWSLGKIAKELNQRGVPTKQGKRWYASTIRYLLRNELYEGEPANPERSAV